MYVAIIGNLVGSRKKNDCREIDPQLNTILDQINGIYHDQLASRFCLTRADSFQGLLESPEEVMNILFQLKFQLHP
ncbi:MAG: SatD family protein, partial [Clostridiaceae bacterium]